MIGATEAIDVAQQQLPKVVPAFNKLQPDVEEIRRSNDGGEWVIVFRADNPESSYSGNYTRFVEKEVRVDASNGDLLSVMNPSYS